MRLPKWLIFCLAAICYLAILIAFWVVDQWANAPHGQLSGWQFGLAQLAIFAALCALLSFVPRLPWNPLPRMTLRQVAICFWIIGVAVWIAARWSGAQDDRLDGWMFGVVALAVYMAMCGTIYFMPRRFRRPAAPRE